MASFSIVNNIGALGAQANLSLTNVRLQTALLRLSSGLRINRAGDDPAGLTVANAYRTEQAVLSQGVRNANDGLSSLQIKDDALANVSVILDRMATLATQAASSSSTVDRDALDAEFRALETELNREASVGGLSTSTAFSVVVDQGAGGTVSGTISDVSSTTLGLDTLTLSTAAAASTALTAVVSAVTTLGTVQAGVGSLQNELQFAIGLNDAQILAKQTAESRIRDADLARETSNLLRDTILTQAGMAALAQANTASSAVLTLLQGLAK